MTFLHTGLAIAGLACVAIPIIIHIIMRRRRRPVMWGAMRFLLEAYRKQRRRLLFEQWLLLASRCLLLLLAALAIARPLLAGAGGAAAGGRTVYVLVDNGLVSSAVDGRAALLSNLRDSAKRVLSQLSGTTANAGAGDRAALITLGGPAEAVVNPPSPDVSAVARLVDGIEQADSRTDLAGGLALVAAAVEADRARPGMTAPSGDTFVVVLSDFLDGSIEGSTAAAGGTAAGGSAGAPASALPALPERVKVIALRPKQWAASNIAVTGVEPLRSVLVGAGGDGGAGGGGVRVTVRRSGPAVSKEGSTPVRLRLVTPGAPAGRAPLQTAALVRFAAGQEESSVNLQAPSLPHADGEPGGSSAVLVAQVEPGNAEDAVAADSVFRRPVEVRETIRIALVSPRRFGERARVDELDSSEWLRLALNPGGGGGGGDSGIEVVDVEPGALDTPRLAGLDGVVVARPDLLDAEAWKRLRGFIGGGGLLMVCPPGGEAGRAVQLWPDQMLAAIALPVTVAREARTYEGGDRSGAVVAPPASGGAIPSDNSGGSDSDVLSFLRPELGDLARAVTVVRALPIQQTDSGSAAANGGDRLLALADGTTLLWMGSPQPAAAVGAPTANPGARSSEQGLVVLWGVAPELSWTDLPARPLLLPLVQELIRQGVGRARGSFVTTAGRQISTPARSAELLRLPDPGSAAHRESEGAGEERLAIEGGPGAARTARPVRLSGLFRAVDDRGSARGLIAVNADALGGSVASRTEADVLRLLRACSPDVSLFDAPVTDGSSVSPVLPGLLKADRSGPPISTPLLAAACLLALFEMYLARRASHAEAATPTNGVTSGAAA